jgi:hypothetical protein
MAVRDIPWKFLLNVLRNVRNTFYKKSKPDVNQIVVDLAPDELDDRLRNDHYYEDLTEYTYKYRGEVINLRRPAGVEDGYQMVAHVRGFPHEDGLELMCHYEISRWDAPREHLNGTIYSWDIGEEILKADLDTLGIGYNDL